jgi:hypothetical protein
MSVRKHRIAGSVVARPRCKREGVGSWYCNITICQLDWDWRTTRDLAGLPAGIHVNGCIKAFRSSSLLRIIWLAAGLLSAGGGRLRAEPDEYTMKGSVHGIVILRFASLIGIGAQPARPGWTSGADSRKWMHQSVPIIQSVADNLVGRQLVDCGRRSVAGRA